MPRPRLNDPAGVSDNPALEGRPARIAELVEGFRDRLGYIRSSFEMAPLLVAGDREFNRSLELLKAAVHGRAKLSSRGKRLHPELELIVSEHARRFATARARGGRAKVQQEDIDAAAQHVAEFLRLRRGRPNDAVLRYHVEGLMALLQETSGRPVRAMRYKDNAYDAQFPEGVSQIVPQFFRSIDPSITNIQLANIVIAARRKYVGKPMLFYDFFPGYGLTQDGLLNHGRLVTGRKIERFVPNIPIYYP